MKHKIIAVIQARSNSSRLPRKIFEPLNHTPILGIIISNLRQVAQIQEVWVATTDPGAAEVCSLARQYKAQCFVGDSHNVLSRYLTIASQTQATHIIRATGDNPFVPIENPRQVIQLHLQSEAAVAAYINLPLGMAVESLHVPMLQHSYSQIQNLPQDQQAPYLEHVSTYMKQNPGTYRICHELWPESPAVNLPKKFRLTIDQPEDLQVAKSLATSLLSMGHWPDFCLQHVMQVLAKNPEWATINQHVQQRPAQHSEKKIQA